MKTIQILVDDIKQLSGIDNLQVDFNSYGGGYMLVTVNKETYAHGSAFGRSACCKRLPKKAFEQYLYGLIAGLEFNKK